LLEIIDKTNFKGIKEYYEETSYLERAFYQKALRENLEKKAEGLNQTSF